MILARISLIWEVKRSRTLTPRAPASLLDNVDHLVVGQYAAAFVARSEGIEHAQPEGVDGAVRDDHGFFDGRVEPGHQVKRPRCGEHLGGDARIFAVLQKRVAVALGVARKTHKEPAGGFHAFAGDHAQDGVFTDALLRCLRVGNRVARAAVEQAVAGSCGAVREIPFLHQIMADSPEREVARNATAGSTAPMMTTSVLIMTPFSLWNGS